MSRRSSSDILTFAPEAQEEMPFINDPWKILVVDDDSSVFEVTRMILKDLVFMDRPVELISAFDEDQARDILNNVDDIAVILLDVVMKDEDGGLQLVRYIRKELRNRMIRIILRTGQPGRAPEKQIILDYEINDYKLKTELTANRLYLSVVTALRSFYDLHILYFNQNERIRQAEELIQKESFTQALFDSIGDAIIAVDDKGHIRRMNRKAEELAQGKMKKEKNFLFHLFPLQKETGEELSFYDLSSSAQQPIPLILPKTPDFVHILLTVSVITGDPDKHEGFVLTLRDVTLEKQLQNQLLQSQKMEAIGQLASGVAHDFNNMLGGILLAADQLELELSGQNQELVQVIKNAGEQAGRLTRQLLDFSRKGSITSSAIDIHKVIRQTRDMLMQILDRSIELKIKTRATRTQVLGDDNLVMNSLINLSINAAQAMSGKGRITFTTEDVWLDQEYCSQSSQDVHPGHYISIKVSDKGIGMNKDTLDRIFDPFFTSKEKGEGTGLGLSLVKNMVERHKGSIEVKSKPGKGTTFTILLPTVESEINGEETENVVPQGGHETLLVVDDEELILVSARVMFRDLGYEVLTARKGSEALSILKEKQVDLILTDMIMPGMSGRQLFDELHKTYPHIPVILTSGFSQEQDIAAMKEKGLKAFIQKPYTRRNISRVLREILDKKL